MFEKAYTLFYGILRRTILFIAAGFMCLGTFSAPAKEEPRNLNAGTGDYFRPDYGHTLISSHRSGKGAAPENTLLAIKSNLTYADSGSAIIEMDVQITKDGVLVLYHSLYLDEVSDSAEHFGKKNTTVFSKTYGELRALNLGENFSSGDTYPYRGLRGDDIPDDIRITRLSDVFACVEGAAPGRFRYIIEVKYPQPWAPKIVDGIYELLTQYGMADRVIVASFWPDVTDYIDNRYRGKMNRSANPFEIVDLYGCYTRNDDLSGEDFRYTALQMPYYHDHGLLIVGNLGKAGFIDYAHKYGLSVQYWTVDRPEDARFLAEAGADVLMTDHPDRLREALYPAAQP
jgi:glycerophosphoryl diester phosphodiesterase